MAQRFAFLFLLIAAGGVLLLGKADPQIFDRTRMIVTDAFAPILDALSRPIATGAAAETPHFSSSSVASSAASITVSSES